jgi:hypothetical protein
MLLVITVDSLIVSTLRTSELLTIALPVSNTPILPREV